METYLIITNTKNYHNVKNFNKKVILMIIIGTISQV